MDFGLIAGNLVYQIEDMGAPFYRIVPAEIEVGDMAQAQAVGKLGVEKAGCLPQHLQYFFALGRIADAADEYPGVFEVRRRFHLGDGYQTV